MPGSYGWTFTCNNPGEYRPNFDVQQVAYMVYQLEEGDQEHTPHLQGYVRFINRKMFATVARFFANEGVHLEQAKGSEEQNKAYCTKEPRIAGPWEFGNFDKDAGKKGRRTDLEAVATRVREGAHLRVIANEFPSDFIRYHQGIRAIQELLGPAPAVQRDVEVFVMWGPTGVGKTHRVMMQWPEAYQVVVGRDPWGRYNGQETVLFDEFDYTKWTVQAMNQYLDKWRCPLDARYHDRYAEWKRVVICSNSSPLSWWPEAPLLLIQSFRRRIQGRVYHILNQEMEMEAALDVDEVAWD